MLNKDYYLLLSMTETIEKALRRSAMPVETRVTMQFIDPGRGRIFGAKRPIETITRTMHR